MIIPPPSPPLLPPCPDNFLIYSQVVRSADSALVGFDGKNSNISFYTFCFLIRYFHQIPSSLIPSFIVHDRAPLIHHQTIFIENIFARKAHHESDFKRENHNGRKEPTELISKTRRLYSKCPEKS